MNVIDPPNGWKLETIEDSGGQCAYCNARLRYVFTLSHPQRPDLIDVGSECVRSFTNDLNDPESAREMMFGQWRQKNAFYFKKRNGVTWVIGPRKDNGYYLATAPEGVTAGNFQFKPGKFANVESAKYAITKYL